MNQKVKHSGKRVYDSFWVPSNCFEFVDVPDCKAVIGGIELPSLHYTRMLARAIEKEYGHEVKIINDASFSYFDLEGVRGVTTEYNSTVSALKKMQESNHLGNEDILLVVRAEQMFIVHEWHPLVHQGYYVAGCEECQQRADQGFIYKNGEIRGRLVLHNSDVVFAYDDDPTSAVEAVKVFLELTKLYGKYGPSGKNRKLACIGGKGKMSRWLNKILLAEIEPKSEARMLAKTICEITCSLSEKAEAAGMLWPDDSIRIIVIQPEDLLEGNNTGANQKLADDYLRSQGNLSGIIVVTQRLSQSWHYTKEQQFAGMQMEMYTVQESFEAVQKWHNGMKLHDGEPLLHLLAYGLKRWEDYSLNENPHKVFMAPIEGISKQMYEDFHVLQQKFVLKQGGGLIKTLCQYAPILWDLFCHRRDVLASYKWAIEDCKKDIIFFYRNALYLLRG